MNKTVFLIVDGMADLPIKALNGKTPLEYAYKPNLSSFLKTSLLAYPSVLGKLAPQSDSGVLSDLGYDPLKYSTGRGWFECLGLGMNPNDGDLSLRVNFGEVVGGKMKAVRVYMSKEELLELEKEINERVKLDVPFLFKSGEGYRGGLIIHGGSNKLSQFISNNEPGYDARFYPNGRKLSFAVEVKSKQVKKIKAERVEASYTAKILNDFVQKASKVIMNSRVYKERKSKGLQAPNYMFLRDGAVHDPKLPSINSLYGKTWAAVVGMPLERGIASSAGMTLINGVHEEQNIERDFMDKAEKTVIALKKFDAVYLHVKQTDSVSHLGKFTDKYVIIEKLDKIIIKALNSALNIAHGDTFVITCDHATSSVLKRHINANIPVLISNNNFGVSSQFNEAACKRHGSKKFTKATSIMPFVMGL